MKLLVSVRSAAEVRAALAGGADIIDAKEPSLGSLGAVSPEVLTEIVARVPHHVSMSIVLGDLASPEEVVSAITSLQLVRRPASVYLKLGFAGVRSEDEIERLVATAVAASSQSSAAALVVAVAYADANQAGTAPPDAISRLAGRAGATGVLIDTHTKDGKGLLTWIAPLTLQRWVAGARTAGLMTAVAGGLGLEDLERIFPVAPDVIGLRGAACDGGREGRINQARVRALRLRLDSISGSVQGAEPVMVSSGSRNA
jgi:(5-formylfuran-3-yl)methyl phosphate synthase